MLNCLTFLHIVILAALFGLVSRLLAFPHKMWVTQKICISTVSQRSKHKTSTLIYQAMHNRAPSTEI